MKEHYYLSCISMTQAIANKQGLRRNWDGWTEFCRLDKVTYYPVSEIPLGKKIYRKLTNADGDIYLFLM